MSDLKQLEQEFEAEAVRINGGRKPKFGDLMRNPWASEGNPQRDGYFVRERRQSGAFNPGHYYEFTDKCGKFWETRAKYAFFIDTQPEATAPALDSQNSTEVANNGNSCSQVGDNAAQDLSAAIDKDAKIAAQRACILALEEQLARALGTPVNDWCPECHARESSGDALSAGDRVDAEWSRYLKEGETPLDRLKREIKECTSILNLLIKERERFEFLHSTNCDSEGWEWGVARVRQAADGRIEYLWGLADHSDIDAILQSQKAK